MVEFVDIPDGWYEAEYETGPRRGDGPYTEELDALWFSTDEMIRISAQHSVDADGTVQYLVIVEQRLVCDGLATTIQSHGQVADDRRDAESIAVDFMNGVNDGEYKFRTIGVQVPDDNDFVQFFTISDSELPESMTGEQIIDAIDSAEYEDELDLDGLPDDLDEMGDEPIQVDVFPKLSNNVEHVGEQ